MKSKRKHFFGILLSLVLTVGMMPVLGMTQTVYAAETWSSDLTINSSRTIDGGVVVTGDVTVTIAENVTLTVNDGISAEGKTLTVEGKGTLIVTGSAGAPGFPGAPGGNGGAGVNGNVIVNSGSITVNGGEGAHGSGGGGNGGAGVNGNVTVNSGSITVNGGGSAGGLGGNGGNGGAGVDGNVTVNSGSITVNGGSGGSGGGSGGAGVDGNVTVNSGSITVNGGSGGDGGGSGGAGVDGNVTVNSGSITVNGGEGARGAGGGAGGNGVEGTVTVSIGSATVTGGGGAGGYGYHGKAASGALYGQTVQEKNTESDNWTVIASGNTSEKRYVKIEADGYPLWVSGIQVTSANMNDPGGRGWSYTPATEGSAAILKLTGYDNAGVVGDKYAGIYAEENLIIETTGINTINNPSTDSSTRAIYVGGDLTFKGNGTLNATGGNRTIVAKNVTVESGTVSVSGGKYGIYAYDSSEKGDITINGGAVSAESVQIGIQANKDIAINKGNVTAGSTANDGAGISASNGVTINGGTVETTGASGISASNAPVVISAGVVKATGTFIGIGGLVGVTIDGGTVEATADGNQSWGIFVGDNAVTVNGGNVTASGKTNAVYGNVKNAIAGTGWTNTEGTEGKTDIPISEEGRGLNEYKKIQFPAKADPEPTPKKPQTVGKTTARNTIANSAKKTYDVLYNAVPGASGYDIAYKHKNSSKWAIKKAGKTTRTTIRGLSIKSFYQIKVRAKKAETAKYKAATGAWSPTIYRYFHTTEKIRLASKAKGSFTMSWKKNPQATSYQVMFSTKKNGAGAAKNINTVGKNATSFTKTGLKSGKTYYVQVREIVKIGGVNYIGNISCPVAVKIK